MKWRPFYRGSRKSCIEKETMNALSLGHPNLRKWSLLRFSEEIQPSVDRDPDLRIFVAFCRMEIH